MRRLGGTAAGLLVALAITLVLTGSSNGSSPVYLVRAIFDNAGFAVSGEDVRVSGAPVGSIQSLDVTKGYKAAVTLAITDPRFAPFHANATCAIRPQSLIGERYVDCSPGTAGAPALTKITHGPGTGSYYLPVTRTNSPIDSDIVQDIYQEPIRERFALILNELGTALAARGSDLNAVIRRANPALANTDRVIQILAHQNHQLNQLSTDSRTVLTPLAKVKRSLADFVVQANTTSVASASRAADISRSINEFPPFLRALRPLMADLGHLADQGTPLMDSLGQSAAALSRQFENLTPFAKAARPALIALGKSSAQSQPQLLGTIPLDRRLNRFGTQALPAGTQLDRLLKSLDTTGAIEDLMAVLLNGTSATNGFDQYGHYVRTVALVGDCTAYAVKVVTVCNANFPGASAAADTAADAPAAGKHAGKPQLSETDRIAVQAAAATAKAHQGSDLASLLTYLAGSHK